MRPLWQWLRDIGVGDAGAPPDKGGRRGLHAAEDGMISLLTLLAVLLFLVLIALVANTGRTVRNKIAVQNAADSSASAAGLWMARGMNALTATNHVMGELLAFVVMHNAIAGDRFGSDAQPPNQQANERNLLLTAAYTAVMAVAKSPLVTVGGLATNDPDSSVYNLVLSDNGASATGISCDKDSTVASAKLELKTSLTNAYALMAVGDLLQTLQVVPLIGPALEAAGIALSSLAVFCEQMCGLEWRALDALESFANNTASVMQALFTVLLPGMRLYQDVLCYEVPQLAQQAAASLAQSNGCQGTCCPTQMSLPVMIESSSTPNTTIQLPLGGPTVAAPHTQMVRAAFPWLNYRRQALLDGMRFMRMSQTGEYYRAWTDYYTLKKSNDFYQMDLGGGMYIMQGSSMDSKGQESWTTNSAQADQLFCVMGFTYRAAERPLASVIYRQPNAGGIVAYAQSMIYNANLQDPNGTPAGYQPQVGWNTLNWQAPVGGSPAHEYASDPMKLWTELMGARQTFPWPINNPGRQAPYTFDFDQGRRFRSNFPNIALNWQFKLVPVTRLDDLASQLTSPFQGPVQKVLPDIQQFRTH